MGKRLTVAGRRGRFFWSNGYAWGTYQVRGKELVFTVQRGAITVARVALGTVEPFSLAEPCTLRAGQTGVWQVTA